MESSCFLLKDSCSSKGCFYGNALFVGDAGRPDLAVKSDEVTKEDLASMLYDSLRNKLMVLHQMMLLFTQHMAQVLLVEKMLVVKQAQQ